MRIWNEMCMCVMSVRVFVYLCSMIVSVNVWIGFYIRRIWKTHGHNQKAVFKLNLKFNYCSFSMRTYTVWAANGMLLKRERQCNVNRLDVFYIYTYFILFYMQTVGRKCFRKVWVKWYYVTTHIHTHVDIWKGVQ